MGNKKGDYNVQREVTGRRAPGATRPDPPQTRVISAEPAQRMGEQGLFLPEAMATGPSTLWFNTPAELSRWYSRLHPIRHSIARRLGRIEREQQREREIGLIRDLTTARAIEIQNLGHSDRLNAAQRRQGTVDGPLVHRESRNERQRQILRDEDPLNQFNRRVRRRFEEAMERETNDLADELQGLRISEPPRLGPVQEVD